MNDLTICPDCSYPHHGADCENPRCYSNPTISDEVKAAWIIADARVVVERAEREFLNKMRAQSFEPRASRA